MNIRHSQLAALSSSVFCMAFAAACGGSSPATGSAAPEHKVVVGGGTDAASNGAPAKPSSPGAVAGPTGAVGPVTPVAGGNGAPPVAGGSGAPPVARAAPILPTAVGECPDFVDGNVTFHPAGGDRTVRLFLSPDAIGNGGPLVLYWYATYGSPSQASSALGSALDDIKAQGGVVAAPVNVAQGQFPWLDGGDEDYRLADEIVACAQQKAGVDVRRIHSLGFSAGAIFTTRLSFMRSNYIASVATYSGGLVKDKEDVPPYQDGSNKFPALILTGGASDDVFNTDFMQASLDYQSKLKADGHSAIFCNHGGGHSIPYAFRAAVGQFFKDHPYGTNPSPYVAGGLPAGLESCSL